MKRRELIKSGLLLAGAVSVGMTGCKKDNEPVSSDNHSDFEDLKKQKGIYNISTPMPFNFDAIDEMAQMNKTYKKSKITTLYNNFPHPYADRYNDFFGSIRGVNEEINSEEAFAKYVNYAKQKGFKFVFVMNSPKPLSQKDFDDYKDVFYRLLDFLHDIRVDNIKVANTQIASLINSYRHHFNLSASTSFEYHNLNQFVNLVKTYPNIDTLDIAIDDNRNFKFLKNLKKVLPKQKIELIVNEPCPPGCPARISHSASPIFCVYNCGEMRKDKVLEMCKTARVYPWNLSYYQNYGVDSFKFVSSPWRANFRDLFFLRNYLDCVENGIGDMDFGYFANAIFFSGVQKAEHLKLKDVIQYLPDIEHFVKNGHKCATACGAECTYCNKCAEKITKLINS